MGRVRAIQAYRRVGVHMDVSGAERVEQSDGE